MIEGERLGQRKNGRAFKVATAVALACYLVWLTQDHRIALPFGVGALVAGLGVLNSQSHAGKTAQTGMGLRLLSLVTLACLASLTYSETRSGNLLPYSLGLVSFAIALPFILEYAKELTYEQGDEIDVRNASPFAPDVSG